MAIPILSRIRPRPAPPLEKSILLEKAIGIARRPEDIQLLAPGERSQVELVAKAIQVGSGGAAGRGPRQIANQRPVSAAVLASRAHQVLGPSSNITPVDIALAMQEQGLDMVEPFAPGQPLVPYYGYGRRPRNFDYQIARNTTTQTREDRIPFQTLLQLWKSYDIAQSCTRYSINDLRSMRVRFEAMDGYEENPTKEIAEAKKRLRRPDGVRLFPQWLAQNQRNLWIFDSAPIFRMRDKAGRVTQLKNISAMTLAPMLDYFGDVPEAPAPAYQQFIEGLPWDWLTRDDIIYEPFWPETDSPYGTPPLETVLVNANTDLRLQLYFLQFFTAGSVPEAFAIAPEDMTSGDDIADFEEQYYDYFHGDQSERWGLHWLPNGTELQFYKPQMFDPDLAEYVMRRTIAAFGLTPQNLGILADVNRATSDTQMDQQFRVATLPIVGYYEGVLDSVIQDDWDLPVQIRFDTGREKEDRLMEAEAHQIYWQMGAEGPDEIREKVLGYPVNSEERVPRAVYDPRLGVIPLSHIIAISGDVDPLTGAPRPGTVQRIPYVLPGTPGFDPDASNGQDGPAPTDVTLEGKTGTQYDDAKDSDTKRGAGPRGARPKGSAPSNKAWDPTKTYPTPLYPDPRHDAKKDRSRAELPAQRPQPSSDFPRLNSGSSQERPGYGLFGEPHGSNGQGTGVTSEGDELAEDIKPYDPKRTTYALKEGAAGGGGGASAGGGATAGITSSTGLAGMDGGSSDDDEHDDLVRWQKRSKKDVEKGLAPRHFDESSIRPHVYKAAWSHLEHARSPEQVRAAFDAAFKSAKAPKPKVAGLALVAEDTGRVVLVGRVDSDD